MTPETNEPGQQKDVIADYASELQQIEMAGYERTVRKARNALFWAAGLYFVGEMIGMARQESGFDLIWFIIAIVEAGIFIGLALWTKSKPYIAVVTGLIYFVGLIILTAFVMAIEEGPIGVVKALFSGIIVKVAILINLIVPLKDAKALQEARKNRIE